MTLPLLFEILTGKAVASQERPALRLGPWLQVPVKPLSRRSYLGNQRTIGIGIRLASAFTFRIEDWDRRNTKRLNAMRRRRTFCLHSLQYTMGAKTSVCHMSNICSVIKLHPYI